MQKDKFRKWIFSTLLSPLLFLVRIYPLALFAPRDLKESFKVLVKMRASDRILCDKEGNIEIARKRGERIKVGFLNLCSLGAYQARVQKALLYTFLALSLECFNPLDRKVLLDFLYRKQTLLSAILQKLPLSVKEEKKCRLYLSTYIRATYLQLSIIKQVQTACHRQKQPGVIALAQEALKKGRLPARLFWGTGGAYFMRDHSNRIIGVFKPFDEEPKGPNNPLGPPYQGGLGQRGVRHGCRVGESCHHEVGAYLVDDFLGLGVVPRTYYATFKDSIFSPVKYGSFQEYIQGFTPIQFISKEGFDSILLEEAQLLILLDVVIGNLDRNFGNILVAEGELVAVDHGLCFPDFVTNELETWFWKIGSWSTHPWMDGICDLVKDFPFEQLAWKLQKHCFLEANQMARMRERITLFKCGLEAGFTAWRMAELFTFENLSQLVDYTDSLEERAKELVQNTLHSFKMRAWERLKF